MRAARDKPAVINGAGSGLGGSTARSLARRDADIVVADIDEERVRAVADEIIQGGRATIAAPYPQPVEPTP
ncbi:SDR family NAD(P)-dependent oxidoreductase [Streptomyces sp. NPDC055210]